MRNNILVYVEAAFAIIYLAGGVFLLLGPTLFETRTFQTIFGVLLLAYSGFRFFRAYQKFRHNDRNQNS